MMLPSTIQLSAALLLLTSAALQSHASFQTIQKMSIRKMPEFTSASSPSITVLQSAHRKDVNEYSRETSLGCEDCSLYIGILTLKSKKMMLTAAIISGMLSYNPTISFAATEFSLTQSSSFPLLSNLEASNLFPSTQATPAPISSTPIPSSPIRSSPIPSSPIPSSPIPSSPIASSPISSVSFYSTQLLSSSSISSLSSKVLQKPETENAIRSSENQNQNQAQVNLPSGIRESIAIGAANIPGSY